MIKLPFSFLVHYWLCDLTSGSIFVALSILLSPSICLFVFLFSIKVLRKLLRNYAACERHLFNRNAPHSGRSRPSVKGGSGHPDPDIRGGGRSPKRFFRLFGPHFGLKIRGAPEPLPKIRHCHRERSICYSYDLSCGQPLCKEF